MFNSMLNALAFSKYGINLLGNYKKNMYNILWRGEREQGGGGRVDGFCENYCWYMMMVVCTCTQAVTTMATTHHDDIKLDPSSYPKTDNVDGQRFLVSWKKILLHIYHSYNDYVIHSFIYPKSIKKILIEEEIAAPSK